MSKSARLVASALLLLTLALVVHAAPTARPRPRLHDGGLRAGGFPSPAARPLELVETVPIETSLGNAELRPAARVWLELVRSATTSLDLEEFYLSNWPGQPLEPILDAIVQASKRGVRVRLLLDAKMHRTYPQPADSLGQLPGIEVRTIDFGRITGGIQHAKFFIVDGRTIYLGSQNMDWRSLEHIHELGVRIKDERVAEAFAQVFEMDWAVAGVEASSPDSNRVIGWTATTAHYAPLPIQVVQSRGDTVDVWPSWTPKAFSPDSARWDRDAIVRTIDGARHEVVAQSLQYSPRDRQTPDDAIDQALRRAAQRGVSVKLVISDWAAGGPNMAPLESLSTVPNVEVKLTRVPEWSGGYVPFARVEHCKYMVVDSMWTWVGTDNWEPSYWHRVRNIAVTMRNRPIALQARRSFQASWDAPFAAAVHPGVDIPARAHAETPPQGATKFGN